MTAISVFGRDFGQVNSDQSEVCVDWSPELLSRIQTETIYELAESYAAGGWNANGLDKLLLYAFTKTKCRLKFKHFSKVIAHLARHLLVNPQTGKGIFKVADAHYNLGNDLFTSMLDSTMSYTCGYWEHANCLEEAQNAKLELICTKLGLKPGMSVLDIGCGWGNFACYAAKNFGVSVVGLTISHEQATLARERCKGLAVQILLQDYRELVGSFDRIVSIEMIEAVGKRNLNAYFQAVHRLLNSRGLFLLQAISAETLSRHSKRRVDEFLMWIEEFIFPNGYLPRIDELTKPARSLFIIDDLHEFSTSYDQTLLAWEYNFKRAWPELAKKYDTCFERRWRFYLLACASLFRARLVQLYQIVYAKA